MTRRNDFIKIVDKLIGAKIYSLRLTKGLSRKQLSKTLAVTPQQLQKYERGQNRIAFGRLILIAKALGENVSYFYENIDGINKKAPITARQRLCLEVSRNFMKISDPQRQNAINTIIKTLMNVA